jgi:hypothetical protein
MHYSEVWSYVIQILCMCLDSDTTYLQVPIHNLGRDMGSKTGPQIAADFYTIEHSRFRDLGWLNKSS